LTIPSFSFGEATLTKERLSLQVAMNLELLTQDEADPTEYVTPNLELMLLPENFDDP
jgi:hypothetical protein